MEDKKITYEKALEHICNTCDNKGCPYIHYEKTRCVWYGIIKQAIEKAKRYDELTKEIE